MSFANVDGTNTARSVACPSATQCTLADFQRNVITFNPQTKATIQALNLGGTSPGLTAIACVSTTLCTVVDQGSNGAIISFDPTAAGGGTVVAGSAPYAELQAISCPSSTQCTAMGSGAGEFTFNPAHPDTTVTSRSVPGVDYATALSCPSVGTCVAFGGYNDANHVVSFSPTGTGTIPAATDAHTGPVDGLDCISTTTCVAVDRHGQATTLTNLSGTPVAIDRDAFFNDVDCISATQCEASVRGGTSFQAFGDQGQLLTFDPTAPGTPTPTTFANKAIGVTACSSATRCTSDSSDATAYVDTLAGYDPASPSAQTLHDSGGYVGAMDCPSASLCLAGGSNGVVQFNPVTATGNATVLKPFGDYHVIGAVSCVSATQCTVSSAGDVVTYDPGAPGSFPTPTTVASGRFIQDMDCPSATRCVAIDTTGGAVTFDPTNPGAQTPVQIDAAQAKLSHVACPSPTDCLAIDGYGRVIEGDPADLASWTVNRVDGANALRAISCASATACVLVDNRGRMFTGAPFVVTGAPSSTSKPQIAGSATVGQVLIEQRGGWTQHPSSYAYQWQTCDARGGGCAAIGGATGDTYTLVAADQGHTVRVVETATNSFGSASATSDPTAVVGAAGTPTTSPPSPSSSSGAGTPPAATPPVTVPVNPPGLVETVTTSSGQSITLVTARGQELFAALDQHLLGGLTGDDIQRLLDNGGFSVQIPLSYPAYPGNFSTSGSASPAGIPGYDSASGGGAPSGYRAVGSAAKKKVKAVTLFRYSHTYTKLGTYTAKIRFTTAGKKLLRAAQRSHRKLKVTVRTAYTAKGHPDHHSTVKLTLRPGKAAKHR